MRTSAKRRSAAFQKQMTVYVADYVWTIQKFALTFPDIFDKAELGITSIKDMCMLWKYRPRAGAGRADEFEVGHLGSENGTGLASKTVSTKLELEWRGSSSSDDVNDTRNAYLVATASLDGLSVDGDGAKYERGDIKVVVYLVNSEGEVLRTSDRETECWEMEDEQVSFKAMFSYERIWKRKTKYFPGDTLHVKFEVSFITKAKRRAEECLNSLSTIRNRFRKLYLTESGADVSIKYGRGGRMRVHEFVLLAHSPVFAKLMTVVHHDRSRKRSFKEIDMTDTGKSVIKALVKYIYCGRVDLERISFEKVADLAILAYKLRLDQLDKLCTDYLGEG